MNFRITLFLIILAGFPMTSAIAEDVEVPDPKLREVLEAILRKKDVKDNFFTSENLSKIWFLDASKQGITNLSGLEHCFNLGEVRLNGNSIRDVSPLGELRNIQSLNLANNRIVDPAPLGKIVKLQYLRLDGNEIARLDGLQELSALNVLHLGRNRIQDIRPLVKLKTLWTLKLDNNRISDISPLRELQVDSLDLGHNQIVNVSPLTGQTRQTFTFLQGNRISDIRPLVEMARNDVADRQQFAPYWRVYLADNPLSDESRQMLDELRAIGVRLNLDYVDPAPRNTPEAGNRTSDQPGNEKPRT